MRLLIIVSQNNIATPIYGPETKTEHWQRQEEGRFLELKLAYKYLNPNIGENLEYWKKYVEQHNFYGLAVWIDYDKASIEYLPLKTKQDFDGLAHPKIKRINETKKP